MPENPPINLIRLFDFYLTLMFLISFIRRWDVYANAISILVAVRGRWPKLVTRLAQNQSLIVNSSFFRPALLALALTFIQMICSRVIWPHAEITHDDLNLMWVLALAIPLLAMVSVDLYFVLRVGRFDRIETVKYLDQAENWLGWKGAALRRVTLGYINPHSIVDNEVKKSLTEMGSMIRSSLWWVSLQISLRIIFGLTLWLSWAVRASGEAHSAYHPDLDSLFS